MVSVAHVRVPAVAADTMLTVTVLPLEIIAASAVWLPPSTP
jgi:hypothetical protein